MWTLTRRGLSAGMSTDLVTGLFAGHPPVTRGMAPAYYTHERPFFLNFFKNVDSILHVQFVTQTSLTHTHTHTLKTYIRDIQNPEGTGKQDRI